MKRSQRKMTQESQIVPRPTAEPKAASNGQLFAWALYDWANSPFATLIQTFVFAAYFTNQIAENSAIGTSLWGNTLSAAAVVIALGGPFLGAVADQTGGRKRWIFLFTMICAGATLLLWFVKPGQSTMVALILVGIGTIGVEFAGIFYNAMLPQLAPSDRLGRWSGWGWGLGYAGGLVCLVLAMAGFVNSSNAWFAIERGEFQHVRATFVLVGVWFVAFSLPLFLFTPDSPRTGKPFGQAAREAWRQLKESIRQVRRFRVIVQFLIARMIYADGLATVFAFGGVYAAGTFKMTTEQILLYGIALNLTAGIGSVAFAWVDDRIGPRKTILFSLCGLILFTTLILLAQSPRAFWICGMLLGIFVGPVQAASRSFLSHLAPAGLRNQIFGLYAFSGKATAFLGPLLVGTVTLAAESQRAGMATILLFFATGLVLMWFLPAATQHEGEPTPA